MFFSSGCKVNSSNKFLYGKINQTIEMATDFLHSLFLKFTVPIYIVVPASVSFIMYNFSGHSRDSFKQFVKAS